jgi:hypothetical protein
MSTKAISSPLLKRNHSPILVLSPEVANNLLVQGAAGRSLNFAQNHRNPIKKTNKHLTEPPAVRDNGLYLFSKA